MNLPTRITQLEEQAVEKALALKAIPCARSPIRTPADVVELLAAEVEAVRRNARIDPVEKARTLGLLAAVALRAMDAAASEGRLEAIERVLKLRRETERSKHGRD